MSTPPPQQQQQQQQQQISANSSDAANDAPAKNNDAASNICNLLNGELLSSTQADDDNDNNSSSSNKAISTAEAEATTTTTTKGQWTTVVQTEDNSAATTSAPAPAATATSSSNNTHKDAAAATTTTAASATPPVVKKTFRMRLLPSSSSSSGGGGGAVVVVGAGNKRRKKRKLFHNILGGPTTTCTTATTSAATTAYSSSGSSGDSSGGSSEDEEAILMVDTTTGGGRSHTMMGLSSSSSSVMGKSSSSNAAREEQKQQEQESSTAATALSLSEEETTKVTTASPTNAASPTTTTTTAASSTSPSSSSSSSSSSSNSPTLTQPEGWRVKLYRLNADGSWDDCGTGRIVCLYRQQQQQQQGSINPATTDDNNNKTTTTATATTADSSKQQQQHDSSNNTTTTTTTTTPSPSSTATTTPQIGSDAWLYQETGEATLCVHAEVTKQNRQPRVLLRTRILLRDAYQRQGDNIITWCEPYYAQQQQQRGNSNNSSSSSNNNNNTANSSNNNNNNGVDLALSFQDNAGCLDIWRQITHIQQRAAELLRQSSSSSSAYRNSNSIRNSSNSIEHGSVEDMATQVAAKHHADLQRQQQEELWAHLTNDDDANESNINEQGIPSEQQQQQQLQAVALPHPPTMQNLEEIADIIAALQHTQQRETLAMWIAKDECVYLKQLLELFPDAESKGDYGKLATLAACVKTVLLLNDPTILELIVTVEGIFEQVCSCLEYDPDLRDKANHRWFLRERAKFRTVVPMEDPELVSAIHRSFRVNYLRDTLLRPTMDEFALSTLSSLQTFTHADVVKGVMMSGTGIEVDLKDSYLVRVIRMLGVELHTLALCEWMDLEDMPAPTPHNVMDHHIPEDFPTDPSIVVGKHSSLDNTTWKQYLAPQDHSLASRRLRKRGCLSFLRELFNMVRMSLQPCDKDNFFSVICELDIDLSEEREISDNVSQTSQIVEVGSIASTVRSSGLEDKTDTPQGIEVPMPSSPVKLLSILGSVLSDHNTDVTERGFALEIISGIAMHDPSIIRQSCLEFHETWKKELANRPGAISGRPEANEKKQIIFFCPPYDLLASLLFLLDVETDAGVLLQVSEIMRIILDTDILGDHVSLGAGFMDEAEGIPPGSGQAPLYDQHNQPSGVAATSTDQKQFLSLFYDNYIEWLVTPFQFTTLHPCRPVPHSVLLSPDESRLMQRMLETFKRGVPPGDRLLKTVPFCAVRGSFAVELLSFCVRAHLYRMKFFLLKSRVLGNVLKLLRPHPGANGMSGDRCLKLAALRFLRAILSVNDELYHRHIIQHDLFAPVFEAFRANPVGDNLVSSAIVEMCDYIHTENIKSLLEYIVTKHLSATHPENTVPSLEDVSSPYVSTLSVLRQAYEANIKAESMPPSPINAPKSPTSPGGSRYFGGNGAGRMVTSTLAHHPTRQLNGKALEDQRKFQAVDEEESYFDSDDDDTPPTQQQSHHHPTVVDEVDAAQQLDKDLLQRTPRMFSLTPAPAPPILASTSAHSPAKNSGNANRPIGDR